MSLYSLQPTVAKKNVEKATRDSEVDVKDMLFKCFRRHPFWSFQDLRTATNQPEQHLKQILSDIAIQETGGEYKGLWRLSEDFASMNGIQEDSEDDFIEEILP